jgi:hypothetical protein
MERIKAVPPQSSSKAELVEWLHARGTPIDPNCTKAEAIEYIKRLKRDIPLKSVTIAQENGGHRVLYTPPYHPELQPIEGIWGVAKRHVSFHPAKTLADLRNTFNEGLTRTVTAKTWTGLWKKCLATCREYHLIARADYFRTQIEDLSDEDESYDLPIDED